MDWSMLPGLLGGSSLGGAGAAMMPAMAPGMAMGGAGAATGSAAMGGTPGYSLPPALANQMAQYGRSMMPQAPQGVPLQPIHYARAPGLLNQPY